MIKIGLIAGPGAGKTTLANALTARMKDLGYNWHNIPEYAREFIDNWGAHAVENSVVVPYVIAMKQMRREHRIPKEATGFVTDSPLIRPWFYARKLARGDIDSHIILVELYKMFLRSFRDYHMVVHVVREKPYVSDGTRHQTEAVAKSIDGEIVEMVKSHGFKLFQVSGSTEHRVEMIVQEMRRRNLLGEQDG